jgi:multiple sugar transport system permease protein
MMRTLRAREAWVGVSFSLPAFLLFAALILYPVVDSIRLSFFIVDIFTRAEVFVGFRNFAHVVADANVRVAFVNDSVWTLGSLTGQIALGLVAALLIDQRHWAMVVVRQVLLMPYVVPIIAVALVWRWMLDSQFGIISYWLQQMHLLQAGQSPLALPSQAMATVVVMNIWRGFPFAMLIYWAALQRIDHEQYEAAHIDGANAWQRFRYVTLPNLRDATVTLLVLRTIWTFTYFDLIWLVTRGGPAQSTAILPTYIYEVALGSFQFSYAAAIATLTGVALVVLVVLVLIARLSYTAAREAFEGR